MMDIIVFLKFLRMWLHGFAMALQKFSVLTEQRAGVDSRPNVWSDSAWVESDRRRNMAIRGMVLTVVALAGLLVPVSAVAQNSITLGTAYQGALFTGTGSSNSVALDLGTCSGGTCTLSGVGFGQGLFSSKALYDITSPTNLDLVLTNPSTGLWTVGNAANDIGFSYGPGGSLLTGTLNLLQFQEISPTKSHGQNWYLASADVTVTGGSLDPTPAGASMQLYFNNVPIYFNSLLGSGNVGHEESTLFGHGTVAPTPEPTSMLLLGAGFLLAGGVLRARVRRGLHPLQGATSR
jgi:hypothetical protein